MTSDEIALALRRMTQRCYPWGGRRRRLSHRGDGVRCPRWFWKARI